MPVYPAAVSADAAVDLFSAMHEYTPLVPL